MPFASLFPHLDGLRLGDVIVADSTVTLHLASIHRWPVSAPAGPTPVIVVTARGLRDEAVVASSLSFSRAGGLTVAEVMHWLKTGLDARLQKGSNSQGQPAEPVG